MSTECLDWIGVIVFHVLLLAIIGALYTRAKRKVSAGRRLTVADGHPEQSFKASHFVLFSAKADLVVFITAYAGVLIYTILRACGIF
ncbi:hypothetical protein P0136_00940 [Lentisphaerota bacterium ZTH]|nr:hypothetical protein JYG24_07920 [Lentisphaerota bacterium]WET06579.1 hypothetical protein P0136_00940 [Lentisphaerota bacterium ZTH]